METQTTMKLLGLCKVVKELSEAVSPDLTLRQLSVYLKVATASGPVAQQDLAGDLDQLKTTMSRIVTALSASYMGTKRDGLGLLNVDLDPQDLRVRLISLSKDGERVANRLAKHL